MATSEKWHTWVTETIGGSENYGKGMYPNPWYGKMDEYGRRHATLALRHKLTRKIEMLSEPRFITGGETSELMEALITMIDGRKVLELGMHTGRSSLHFLRAIIGKPDAKLVSVDARPAHDKAFFAEPDIAPYFEFVEGWTPQCLQPFVGQFFDFVFVDSDHSVEHTTKELEMVRVLTRRGSIICFHDCPAWQTPANRVPPPVRTFLLEQIQSGAYSGMILPSPRQLDCAEEWGADYPKECSPGLAILVKQ